MFYCENPNLKIQILKNVLKQTEKSHQGTNHKRTQHWFKVSSGEVVGIAIWRFRHNSNTTWDYDSDEQIARAIGMVPLCPIEIDNKTWIKYAYLKFENYVNFGYFKRMDNNLVAVYCEIKNDRYKSEIESYKATRVLSESQKQLINEAFDHLNELVKFRDYYEYAETKK